MPPNQEKPESEKEILRRLKQMSDKELSDLTAGLTASDLSGRGGDATTPEPGGEQMDGAAGGEPYFQPESSTLAGRAGESTDGTKLQEIVELLREQSRDLQRMREIMDGGG